MRRRGMRGRREPGVQDRVVPKARTQQIVIFSGIQLRLGTAAIT